VLVNVPLDSCGTLDFHRAKDMIEVGRERAIRAFDAWEEGEPLVL
jgi:NTE family protein